MPVRHTFSALGPMFVLAGALVAAPAQAQDSDEYYEDGVEAPALPPMPAAPMARGAPGPGPVVGYSVEEREGWIAECRERVNANGDRVGGAVIGGVVGGVAGNRIAGRGNRVVGTVIGAGVGAVAGAAIDGAVDRGEARDFCEDYLDRYEASYAGAGPGYAYAGGAYGHPGMMPGHPMPYGSPYYGGRVMWVPVKISGGCCCKPKQRVVEEYVEQPAPPPARRVIPDKRVKITKPSKYTKYSK